MKWDLGVVADSFKVSLVIAGSISVSLLFGSGDAEDVADFLAVV